MLTRVFEQLCQVSGAPPVSPGQPLPSAPGAYLLLLRLKRELRPPIRRFGGLCFPPGLYVYAGNALGPGGIGARVKRHFRTDKRVHWHIDYLTTAGAVMAAFPCTAGRECELIEALLNRAGFAVAAKGFGSSDCRSCESHLLRVVGECPSQAD